MQVAIFKSNDTDSLQEQINDFLDDLQSRDMQVVDIKYTAFNVENYVFTRYTAMIIYKRLK